MFSDGPRLSENQENRSTHRAFSEWARDQGKVEISELISLNGHLVFRRDSSGQGFRGIHLTPNRVILSFKPVTHGD